MKAQSIRKHKNPSGQIADEALEAGVFQVNTPHLVASVDEEEYR